MTEAGLDAYHDRVCAEVGAAAGPDGGHGNGREHELRRGRDAKSTRTLAVTAAVTAGVEGNATAAGEPATWRETETGMQKVPAYAGTINTMLLINRPLTPAALARVVVTMTEGKSAALHRLAVPSRLHVDLATGTGTDQYCIAAPLVRCAAADVGESAHEARRARRARHAQRDASRRCAGRTASKPATRAGCSTRSADTA